MNYPEIVLRKGKEQSLERLHPWVFSGAVARQPDNIEEGDTVKVVSSTGNVIGTGHYQIGSITVRILAWGDSPVDAALYSERLKAAYQLRRALKLINRHNNAYRLVHGEGRFSPRTVR